MNAWIKQKCAHFNMIPYGLEELGSMIEVSKFKRGEDIITQYMIESDHSYIFAELDEGETTWKLLSRIPGEIMCQIDEEVIEKLIGILQPIHQEGRLTEDEVNEIFYYATIGNSMVEHGDDYILPNNNT